MTKQDYNYRELFDALYEVLPPRMKFALGGDAREAAEGVEHMIRHKAQEAIKEVANG